MDQDFKWRAFGRGVMKVEAVVHIITLGFILSLGTLVHNPYNEAYHDFDIYYKPHPHVPGKSHGSAYANTVTPGLLLLTCRVFLYEISSIIHSSNFSQWAKSVWNWINILSVSKDKPINQWWSSLLLASSTPAAAAVMPSRLLLPP